MLTNTPMILMGDWLNNSRAISDHQRAIFRLLGNVPPGRVSNARAHLEGSQGVGGLLSNEHIQKGSKETQRKDSHLENQRQNPIITVRGNRPPIKKMHQTEWKDKQTRSRSQWHNLKNRHVTSIPNPNNKAVRFDVEQHIFNVGPTHNAYLKRARIIRQSNTAQQFALTLAVSKLYFGFCLVLQLQN